MNTKLQPNLEIINATKTRLVVSDGDGNMSYLRINKGASIEYWIEVYKPSII